MASAPVGEVVVDVVANIADFTEVLQRAIEAMAPPAATLLLAYTDWLENQRRLTKPYNGGDTRASAVLVAQFLEERRAARAAERDAEAEDLSAPDPDQ
jgi:hypothetical protein